jgi:photosystem II stability/assembly factor-like uncharacterized protein
MKKTFLLWLFSIIFFPFDNVFSQWTQTGTVNGDVRTLAVGGAKLFASSYGGGVSLSTDNGNSWAAINNGLASTDVPALIVQGTNIFAGTFNRGVFLSTNSGTSWIAVNNGLPKDSYDTNYYAIVQTFAISGINLFAGTYYGVFLSTNSGTSWTATNSGLTSTNVISFAVSDTNLFAGTNGGGVFLSTNNGNSWVKASTGILNFSIVHALTISDSNLYAGTNPHIFFSTNKGTSWATIENGGLTSKDVWSLAVNGTNLFAGTYNGGVFLTTNNGISWRTVNDGMQDTSGYVFAFASNGTYLFAATGHVWRRPLSEMVTGIEKEVNHVPSQYVLQQNYPNPFNPATTIFFSLPSKSSVSLKVFDIIGREVATLVSEEMSAGNHTRQWNAVNMPSGIYFYRLQAGSFTDSKKLVLLR